MGHSSTGTATINVQNGGSFSSSTGNIGINATGTLNVGVTGAGTFSANGNVTVNGGTINRGVGGNFDLANGKTLTATNNAQLSFTGDYDIDGGTTFDLQSGADLTVTSTFLDIGSTFAGSGNGTLVADGSGTSVTASGSGHAWGFGGLTGDVTFRNDATGSFGSILLAVSATAGTTGIVNVQTGADVTVGSLQVANGGGTTTSGTITVDGGGSTLMQTVASILDLGHATDGTATINVTNGGTFDSGTGAITINATGEINIGTGMTGGTFNANGDMTIDGTVNLIDGAMNAGVITLNGGAFNFTGGVLSVDSFIGNLDNQGGTLAPGNTPGVTNVTGDYTNGATGTVQIEIASANGVPGTDFDQVNIGAAAILDGSLFADVGFAPAHQDSFQVMTFASHSGVFNSVTDAGLPSTLVMAPFYTATDLTLSVELIGDVNGDGDVSAADYTIWANNFGIAEPSYGDGDLNRDGMVSAADYTIWANNFGLTAPPPSPESVPEPSTFLLLLIGTVGLIAARQRSRY